MEQALLSTSLELLCKKLSEKLINVIRRKVVDVDELATNLKDYLLAARMLYNDAEESQITRSERRDKLVDLKELIHDAEDLLEMIDNESLLSKHQNEFSTTASQVVHYISKFFFPFGEKIEPEVAKTVKGLERILHFRYIFDDVVKNKPLRIPSPLTHSVVQETEFYGRESDVQDIIGSLMSHDSGSKVTMIVGRDGIGKTSLARRIFSDHRILEHFDLLVWVSVSYGVDVFRKILQEVTNETNISESGHYQRLMDGLMGKDLLCVLDHDCNGSYVDWNTLERVSEFGGNSKIIVTTVAASQVGNIPRIVYPLNSLSNRDHCWSLFEEHVSDLTPSLKKIGKQIVSRCDGIPLAIKFFGCLLSNERNEDVWLNILNQLNNSVWKYKRENDILPALWICYFSLPPPLKPCLTFCSIFPPNYKIHKEFLISLWMAHGYLKFQDGKTMEEVGEEYLNDLKSRLFFQQRENEVWLTMHPLVTYLITHLSREFTIRLEDINSFSPVKKTQHFSYSRAVVEDVQIFGALSNSEHLHTFLPIGPMEDNKKFESIDFFSALNKLFKDHPFLRAVSLSMYPTIERLPDSIASFKYGRYLDLSYTGLRSIPDAVCSLVHLQTLKLVSCKALTRLPSGLRNLINLHCLETTDTPLEEMPPQMSNLQKLQILTDFVLGKDSGSGIKELGNLPLRGGLCISGLQNVIPEDIVEANLGGKKLTALDLKWSGSAIESRYEHDVLNKLQPSTRLQSLWIDSYRGTRFPDWLGNPSFSALFSIRLTGGENCFLLPWLGQLPCLRELFIEGFGNVVEINDNGHVTNPFPLLEILHFCNMQQWRVWSFPALGAFPRLRNLSLKDCPNLTGSIPITVEIRHIEGCPRLQVP